MKKIIFASLLALASTGLYAKATKFRLVVFNNNTSPIKISCQPVGEVTLAHPVRNQIIPAKSDFDFSGDSHGEEGGIVRCSTDSNTFFEYEYYYPDAQELLTNGPFSLEEDYEGIINYTPVNQ